MKNIDLLICTLLLVVFSFGMAGCYKFAAEHPEKSEKAFYEDRAYCEKKAREYAMERRENMSDVDEINHAKHCMKRLGWEYRFRSIFGEKKLEKKNDNE